MDKEDRANSVVVIGSGNVAWHLAMGLYEAGAQVLEVCSPNILHARHLAGKVNANALDNCGTINPHAGLYLLAIPDDHVETVVRRMPRVKGVVCHTSGMTPLKALHRFERYGVFYPLQTFSKNKEVALQEVPFCLEACSPEVYALLEKWAGKLSPKVYAVSTEKRMKLHLAAVFVNNFTNHLFVVAENFLKENGLEKEMLMPLIRETVDKLRFLPAEAAQTGPARRGDLKTIEKHLKMLDAYSDLKAIYQLFSEQMIKKYHEQLQSPASGS